MPTHLYDLAVISARGPDSRKFLHGQLSQDVITLSDSTVRLAGYHTPQGRLLAVLRLLGAGADDVLLVLPRELAAPIVARLSKFVLRAKTVIRDESDRCEVLGYGEHAAGAVAWADRAVAIVPRDRTPLPPDSAAMTAWRLADIGAGLPQVYAATSEQFVAQMLNLDVVDGIAFDKGCYTGQEIVARTHYRGRVKRRMQRFETRDSLPLAPGNRIRLSDGRAAQIVDAAARADGAQELLAVTTVPAGGSERGDANDEPANPTDQLRRIDATPLPMPYSLAP